MQQIELSNANYPSNLTKVRNNKLKNRLTRKTGLFGVSMKNFGINLASYLSLLQEEAVVEEKTEVENRTYRGSWTTDSLLTQIYNLINQLYLIYRKKKAHGDVRALNIMIDPTTHVMRLIDFDYFGSFKDVSKAYMGENIDMPRNLATIESIPPEYLVLRDINTNEGYQHFAESQLRCFPLWYYVILNSDPNNNQSTSVPFLIDMLKNAIEHNPEIVQLCTLQKDSNLFLENTVPYLDGFGLALPLLEMIMSIYKCMTLNKKDERIMDQIINLLRQMSDLNIAKRLNPKQAYDIICNIRIAYDEEENNYFYGSGKRTRKQRKRRASKN